MLFFISVRGVPGSFELGVIGSTINASPTQKPKDLWQGLWQIPGRIPGTRMISGCFRISRVKLFAAKQGCKDSNDATLSWIGTDFLQGTKGTKPFFFHRTSFTRFAQVNMTYRNP